MGEWLAFALITGATLYLVGRSLDQDGRPENAVSFGGLPPEERDLKIVQEVVRRLPRVLENEAVKETPSEDRPAMLAKSIAYLVVEVGAEHAIPQTGVQCRQRVQDVLDEMVGLGPLESLLRDPAIRVIHVQGPKRIAVSYAPDGQPAPCEKRFRDEAHLQATISRIATPQGCDFTAASIAFHGVLADGSLVDVERPPETPELCGITILKPPPEGTEVWEHAEESQRRTAALQARLAAASDRFRTLQATGT